MYANGIGLDGFRIFCPFVLLERRFEHFEERIREVYDDG